MAPVKLINATQTPIGIMTKEGKLLTLAPSKEHQMQVKITATPICDLEFTTEDDPETIHTCVETRTELGVLVEPIPPPQPGVRYIVTIIAYEAALAVGRTDVVKVDIASTVRNANGNIMHVAGISQS